MRRTGELDIVEAALLVAAEEYRNLDVDEQRNEISAYGEELARRMARIANPFARLDGLRGYLAEELGLDGNTADYYDPRNSFVNEVVGRGLGIPLTLSLLYVDVARRAGLQARGVALPGHFVVRLDLGDRRLLIDPFRHGELVSEEDCRELVRRSTGRASLYRSELLEGCGEREMLTRLLRNLKGIYLARKDHERALAAVERLLLIQPHETAELRDRGFLLAHLDRPGAAMTDLESYLDLAPDAPDAASVRGRIAWLRRRISETN